jgi:hypothetical protein
MTRLFPVCAFVPTWGGGAYYNCSYYWQIESGGACWDRLFGTYLNPKKVEVKEIAFGVGQTPDPVRLTAGL